MIGEIFTYGGGALNDLCTMQCVGNLTSAEIMFNTSSLLMTSVSGPITTGVITFTSSAGNLTITTPSASADSNFEGLMTFDSQNPYALNITSAAKSL